MPTDEGPVWVVVELLTRIAEALERAHPPADKVAVNELMAAIEGERKLDD